MSTREQENIVLLCREMGWTYDEYLEQPDWVIERLISVIKKENKK